MTAVVPRRTLPRSLDSGRSRGDLEVRLHGDRRDQVGPVRRHGPHRGGGHGGGLSRTDTLCARHVAIKVLPEQFAHDPARLTRFERETKALAALSHPNILAIYDYGCQDSICFAVTELLDGETLRARLRRSPLPWRPAVEVAAAVAEGLAAAHAREGHPQGSEA